MKVGILEKVISGLMLDEELTNGWDLVLAGSDAGKSIRCGSGFQLFFKDPLKKLPVHKQLEKLDWAAWGYNGYLLTGVPLDVIVRQLQTVFPSAEFYYVGTHEKFMV